MKLLIILISMLVAGILGYMFEPNLRSQLTGILPGVAAIAESKPVLLQMPDGKRIELASLPAKQLPKSINLKNDFSLYDQSSGVSVSMAAGSEVNLVRINGANAIVSQGEGSFQVKIPISETNLIEKLSRILLSEEEEPSEEKSAPAPVLVPTPVVPPAPVPVVTQKTPVADPPPVATAPVAKTEPEPVTETIPAPEPPLSPEPPPASLAVDGRPVDVVKTMQESIRAGQIKEFAFEAVSSWKAEPNETIDDENYQIGIAFYKAETVLGVKTMQAKALIKDGKVQRWIRPKTGSQIK